MRAPVSFDGELEDGRYRWQLQATPWQDPTPRAGPRRAMSRPVRSGCPVRHLDKADRRLPGQQREDDEDDALGDAEGWLGLRRRQRMRRRHLQETRWG